MEPQNAENIDSNLASVPDMVTEFWQNLRPSRLTAPCPQCDAPSLEVRTARAGGTLFAYVLHCGDVQAVVPIWGTDGH